MILRCQGGPAQYELIPLGLRMGPLWGALRGPTGTLWSPMGPYRGWGNMGSTARGLEWGPYGSPTGPYGGPMEPYGALRGLEQYGLNPLGLRMGPLWEEWAKWLRLERI